MKIYEYQARQLLADAGVPVPDASVAKSVEEVKAHAARILKSGAEQVVVKAQVHAGGRGKAGFVKLVKSVDEAVEAGTFMLNNRMVSNQTGPEGLAVTTLLVAEAVDIEHEYYVAITTDRGNSCNALIASSEGGVEIETVAESNPQAIHHVLIDPLGGLEPYQARALAFELGMKGKQINQAASIVMKLVKLYESKDASLVEINPLILTPATADAPDGRLLAIDAKFNFDDNALFRHKDIESLHDKATENPSEQRAKEAGLNFVALDGNIGCLVNGAGLAMSTMDIIKLAGGEPANFLDVGGGADEEAVTEAFRIILGDEKVQGVLVNIFGGIMQCDRIARSIVTAANEVGFSVPLVVRLEGTNVDEAREILRAAQDEIPTLQGATDLADAATKVAAAVNN